MKIYHDGDVSLDPLQGRTVAVLGYGNQGRAQALNLRDSGMEVIVGNRDDEYGELARKEGWEPVPLLEAAGAGDILLVLTTDESMPFIWDEHIAPGIEAGNTLCWGSGYNVGYKVIEPPEEADAIMIAPIMMGNIVRERYEAGGGVVGQFAVERDATGTARETAMALCKGMGLTRAGIYESSFLGEAYVNLYTEQVVWAGIHAWLEFCFELAVDRGLPPEEIIMVLYASTENAEVFSLMARYGIYRQMRYHSTTSQYGTMTRAKELLNDEIREKARSFLVDDIMGGAFVKEFTDGHVEASRRLEQMRAEALEHPMSRLEGPIIEMIQRS